MGSDEMKNHQLINQDSHDYEYYTPLEIVNAARFVMGGITLDPFSSDVANKKIGAEKIFTVNDNGLSQKWFGKVWMNHPFGRKMNKLCIEKIVKEYISGNIEMACCITFAATSELWFKPLLEYPQCFLSPRTNYFLPNGELKRGVTKGSVVTYFGEDINKFKEFFSKFGVVKITA